MYQFFLLINKDFCRMPSYSEKYSSPRLQRKIISTKKYLMTFLHSLHFSPNSPFCLWLCFPWHVSTKIGFFGPNPAWYEGKTVRSYLDEFYIYTLDLHLRCFFSWGHSYISSNISWHFASLSWRRFFSLLPVQRLSQLLQVCRPWRVSPSAQAAQNILTFIAD